MNGDELLVRVDANLQGLVKNFDEFKNDTKAAQKDNAIEHQKIRDCITGTTSKYLEKAMFWKIMGFLTSGGLIAIVVKIFM